MRLASAGATPALRARSARRLCAADRNGARRLPVDECIAQAARADPRHTGSGIADHNPAVLHGKLPREVDFAERLGRRQHQKNAVTLDQFHPLIGSGARIEVVEAVHL